MKIIDIIDYRDEVFSYCYMCGTCNLDSKGKVTACKHLVYVGMNEEGDGPIFDKTNLYTDYNVDEYKGNFIHYLKNKLKLDDSFTLIIAGDRTLQSYLIYQFNSQ